MKLIHFDHLDRLDNQIGFHHRSIDFSLVSFQIKLACEVQKPLFLHERDAHAEMVELLTRYKSQLPTCVIHCFTGTKEQAITYLSLGCYIGLTGYLWKDKSEDGVRKILQDNVIPLDRLLVETDAPFMYPNTRASKLPQHVKDAMTDRYHFHYHFQIVFEMLSDICTGLPCSYKDTAHFNATNLAPCP